jgi:hypothetical protein
MGFTEDLAHEKAKLVQVVQGNKLARAITSNILEPILSAIEEMVPHILESAGQMVVKELMHVIETTAKGNDYMIYYVDPNAPKGQQIQDTEYYNASVGGMPPGNFTGSLVQSIRYDIDISNGSVSFGLPAGAGTGKEFESMSYFPGKIYVDVTGERNTKTPAGKYGNALDIGYTSKYGNDVHHPWFRETMDAYLRDEVRQFIRSELRKALNKVTRKTSVRKALVFKVYFRK